MDVNHLVAKNNKGRASRVRGKRNPNQRDGRAGRNAARSSTRDMSHVADTRVRRFTPMCFGFPDRLMTTLRYHEIQDLISVTGTLAQLGYRWNSIYAPAYSGGHQPLYRDTYAAIYDQYAVVSARARIEFVNDTQNYCAFVGANTDDDSSPSTNTDTLAEQNHGVSSIIGHGNGGRASIVWNLSWDCKKVLGIDPYTSEAYKTLQGANPSETSYLWLSSFGCNAASTTVLVSLHLEYDVLFTELSTPTQS